MINRWSNCVSDHFGRTRARWNCQLNTLPAILRSTSILQARQLRAILHHSSKALNLGRPVAPYLAPLVASQSTFFIPINALAQLTNETQTNNLRATRSAFQLTARPTIMPLLGFWLYTIEDLPAPRLSLYPTVPLLYLSNIPILVLLPTYLLATLLAIFFLVISAIKSIFYQKKFFSKSRGYVLNFWHSIHKFTTDCSPSLNPQYFANSTAPICSRTVFIKPYLVLISKIVIRITF